MTKIAAASCLSAVFERPGLYAPKSFLGRFCERTAASNRRAGSEISCSKADLQPTFLVLSYAPGSTAKLMIYAFEGELKYFISDYKIIIIFLCRTVPFISTLPLISIHVNASLQKPQPVTSVTGDFFFLRKKHCSNLFSRKAIIRILSGLNVRNSL